MLYGLSLPEGFALHEEGRCVLIARGSSLGALVRAGYAAPATWEAWLGKASGPGRGGTARVLLPDGPAVLKRMRRGGLTAPLWQDRFPGAARLVGNLVVAVEVARRGVPTAAPLTLLLRRGRVGLYEGWLGVAELPGAMDLLSRLERDPPPGRPELAAVLAQVRRMHDAGIEHRDLNLGNLLVRPAGEGWEAFVIDLDRAVLHDGPLPPGLRQSALRRLERSYAKRFRDRGPLPAGSGVWSELYAAHYGS
jgi:3-deoxy-D-manno-octulosonic acid kinase